MALVGDRLVVAWTSAHGGQPSFGTVSVQAFTLDGSPAGPAQDLDGLATTALGGIDVIAAGDRALVAWVGAPEPNTARQARARLVSTAGEPVGEALEVGTWRQVWGLRLVATSAGALVVMSGNHMLNARYRIDAVPLTCAP
ncbi:MAG: hypothetical protein EOO75_17690 [Myxococcales bacterium]|nr:MAG: hypothetical protein EOO75_17690 [Myxococcales bacterium]